MKVLNIDLDFFLSRIRHLPNGNSRPSSSDFTPWPVEDVHNFMKLNCGLAKTSKLPSVLVNTHDEVFDLWKEQIINRQLQEPFDVFHVDAHADLGLGDSSFIYILGELLHAAPHERQEPKRDGLDGLNEGNYLAFAIACRWLKTMTYVHHPMMRNDMPRFLFRNQNTDTRVIELNCYSAADARNLALNRNPPRPIATEPPVPIKVVSKEDFRERGDFVFGYLSKSPKYTPLQAEELIPEIGKYLQFFDRASFLQITR